MTPAKLKLTIYQGATFKRILRVKDAAGDPIDLTGASARMHVRENIADETPLLILDKDNARLVATDPEAGELTLLISAGDTAALAFQSGFYDLEIAYSNGTVDRLLEGTIKLSKEVTR